MPVHGKRVPECPSTDDFTPALLLGRSFLTGRDHGKQGVQNMSNPRKSSRATLGLRNERTPAGFASGVDQASTSSLAPAMAQKLEKLPQLLQGLKSEDSAVKLDAVTQIRALLLVQRQPPIDELVAAGVVPLLVQLLSDRETAELQVIAARSLAVIASGSAARCHILFDQGAMPFLSRLLASPMEAVRMEALRVLGEVAGQSPMYRDYLLQGGIMEPLLHQLESSSLRMLRIASQALANLCNGYPLPHWNWVVSSLRLLARLIYTSSDAEVLSSLCWALAGLTDDGGAGDPSDRLQTAIEAGPVRRLVELLMHPAAAVQIPALRTIGNLLCGTDMQTQVVLNFSVLPCLLLLLSSPKRVLRQDALWALSNVTAGPASQIQMVMEGCIIPPVLVLVQTGEYDVKKVAALVIANAVAGGDEPQIRFLLSHGCVPALCSALTPTDAVPIALDALAGIFGRARKARGYDPAWETSLLEMLQKCGGLDRIVEVEEKHESPEVRKKAASFINTYLNEPNFGDRIVLP